MSFGDITRRAGLVTRRLFAILNGTETPADVAAIMSWFHEDPERLASAAPVAAIAGSGDARAKEREELIPVAALSDEYTAGALAAMPHTPSSERSWTRFMETSSPRSARPAHRSARLRPAGSVTMTMRLVPATKTDAPAYDPAVERSLAVFERLFALLTKPGGRRAMRSSRLISRSMYARASAPDAAQAKAWIEELIRQLIETEVPDDRRNDVAAAVLTIAAMQAEPTPPTCRWARHCLLKLGLDFTGAPLDVEGVRGFAALMPAQISFAALWPRLRTIRTFPEQVRAYLRALENQTPSESDYPDLRQGASAEWALLESAITSETARTRLAITPRDIGACPCCFITLPAAEAARLRSIGIASARGCCSRVVIWVGD